MIHRAFCALTVSNFFVYVFFTITGTVVYIPQMSPSYLNLETKVLHEAVSQIHCLTVGVDFD